MKILSIFEDGFVNKLFIRYFRIHIFAMFTKISASKISGPVNPKSKSGHFRKNFPSQYLKNPGSQMGSRRPFWS